MRNPTLIFLLLISCLSGYSQSDGGYTHYKDEATGWSTRYPNSFILMTAEEVEKLEGRGKQALENTVDVGVEMSHKNLLWLKKDVFNMMTSNSQPYDLAVDGPYEDSQKLIYEMLEEAYKAQGLDVDVKYSTTKIDGLDFFTMQTIIYAPGTKNILMTQMMYDRLFDGKIGLTLNINFNNESDKGALLEIINSSKFSIRK
jgi:hypothetical protein